MAEFQVTASALKEKAELLRQLGERYTNKVQELVLAQQKLSASWEGAGKAAFDCVFQEDCMKMDPVSYTHLDVYKRQISGCDFDCARICDGGVAGKRSEQHFRKHPGAGGRSGSTCRHDTELCSLRADHTALYQRTA